MEAKTPIESLTYFCMEDLGENCQILGEYWKGESQKKEAQILYRNNDNVSHWLLDFARMGQIESIINWDMNHHQSQAWQNLKSKPKQINFLLK